MIITGLSKALQAAWFCHAEDQTHQLFDATHLYELPAKALALTNCKQKSLTPQSCTMKTCDLSEAPTKQHTAIWQCTAYDQMGKEWQNIPNKNRDLAAITAKDGCIAESGFPDTCYVNLMTCQNLNAH